MNHLAAMLEHSDQHLAGIRTCRNCGCHQDRACYTPLHGACWWVEPDLCSHCAEPAIVLWQLQWAATTPMSNIARQALLAAMVPKAIVALQRVAQTDASAFEL